jgi:hypothetical protein
MQTALLYPKKRAALELGQRPIPKPTGDQIQIQILSAALNPVSDSDNSTFNVSFK